MFNWTIKVKHLVAIILILVSVMIGYPFVIKPLVTYSSELLFGQQQQWKKFEREVLLENSNTFYTVSDTYISNSSQLTTQMNQSLLHILANNEERLQQYIEEAPVSNLYSQAISGGVKLALAKGDYNAALEVVELGLRRMSLFQEQLAENEQYTWKRTEQQLLDMQVRLLMESERLTEAEQLLAGLLQGEQLNQNSSFHLYYVMTLVRLKNYEEAWSYSKQLVDGLGKDAASFNRQEILNSDEAIIMMYNQLDDLRTNEGSAAQLSGKLLRQDGTPIVGATIYLRHIHQLNISIRPELEPYRVVTAADGSYAINGILPGTYQLTLGFTFDQIDGYVWTTGREQWFDVYDDDQQGQRFEQPLIVTPQLSLFAPINEEKIEAESFEFNWEAVPEAAYYNISLGVTTEEVDREGGSSTSKHSWEVANHIETNRVVLQAHHIFRQLHPSVSWTDRNDWTTLHVENMLVLINSDLRLSWSVNAYDSAGQLLSSSEGYQLTTERIKALPFFSWTYRDLTPEDNLLRAGEVEQALQAYIKSYEHSEDIYSLFMVERLLYSKYFITKQAEDYKQWLDYALQLQAKVPSVQLLERIISYYYKQEEWETYERLQREYTILLQQPSILSPTRTVSSRRIQASLKQQKFEEAQRFILQSLEEDVHHTDAKYYYTMLLFNGHSITSLKQEIRNIPDRTTTYNKIDWYRLAAAMEQEEAQLEARTDKQQYRDVMQTAIERFWSNQLDTKSLHSLAAYPAMQQWFTALLEH